MNNDIDFKIIADISVQDWNDRVASIISYNINSDSNTDIGATLTSDSIVKIMHVGRLAMSNSFSKAFNSVRTLGMSDVNISGNSMSNMLIMGAHIEYTTFESMIIKGCIFYNSEFVNIVMNDVILDSNIFINCNFKRCTFSGTEINKIRMVCCNTDESRFDNLDINNLVTDLCIIKSTDFSSSTMFGWFSNMTDIRYSNFKSSNVVRSIISDSEFTGTSLLNASFHTTKLLGVKIKECNTHEFIINDYNVPDISGDIDIEKCFTIISDKPGVIKYIQASQDSDGEVGRVL